MWDIYNEFFAIPLDIFGSSWYFTPDSDVGKLIDPQRAYPFGFDPVWKGKANEFGYTNSFKMKLSVILGIIQMSFGVFLSLVNAINFKNKKNIWFEFLPQIIFIQSIFGYLVILIIMKWCIDWGTRDIAAPNLIDTLVLMLLPMNGPIGYVPPDKQIYPHQGTVQMLLLITAILAIPWMLLPKPILIHLEHKNKNAQYHSIEEAEPHGSDHDGEEFDVSEIYMHQIIHTIEYVLGAISNTASYLRLWALSLAHSQLASVFFEKLLMEVGVESNNPVLLIVAFAGWTAITFGVLLIMESLSAFLHALRLHWVEFQNKFYMGDGYKFQPFSFEKILDECDKNTTLPK